MFFVYWKLGAADYLSEPAKWPVMRYITSDILSGSAKEEWLVNRAMDLLTVSLPFVLFGAVKHPRFLRILPVVIGCIALLLPLRRANLLAVALAVLILVGIERSNLYQLTRKVLVCVAIVYIVSQCIFLIGIIAMDVSPKQVVMISSTALPEVRDLAWTLSLLHGESLNGTTFEQALIPLPSIASDWSSRHSLRAISTKLIGLDETSETGGPAVDDYGRRVHQLRLCRRDCRGLVVGPGRWMVRTCDSGNREKQTGIHELRSGVVFCVDLFSSVPRRNASCCFYQGRCDGGAGSCVGEQGALGGRTVTSVAEHMKIVRILAVNRAGTGEIIRRTRFFQDEKHSQTTWQRSWG